MVKCATSYEARAELEGMRVNNDAGTLLSIDARTAMTFADETKAAPQTPEQFLEAARAEDPDGTTDWTVVRSLLNDYLLRLI